MEFREVFNLVDRDRSGSISRQELAQLMLTLSINASQQELDLMIDEIDSNKNGEIEFEEFVAVMSKKVQATYSAAEVKSAFRVFAGTAPQGHVRLSELERALTVYGADRLSPEQVAELVSQIDCDAHGFFNFEEYVDMMLAE